MVTFFKELFEYSHHDNQKLGTLLTEHENVLSEKSRKLFSHMLNVHHIWNHRIELLMPLHGVWDMQAIKDYHALDDNNFQHTLRILDRYDIHQLVKYKTSKVEPFENSIKDLLFHVVNHSTYHRAQIATEFKQAGIEPLVTDYIYYKR